MRIKLRFQGILGLALLLATVTSGCTKLKSWKAKDLSSTSLTAVDPIVIDRAQVPKTSKASVTLSGKCLNGASIGIEVTDSPTQTIECVNGVFAVTLTLDGLDGLKTITASQTDTKNRVWKDSISITKDTVAPIVSILTVTKVASGLTITGACEMDAPLALTGDISATANIPCTNGLYQITAMPTVGDGQKNLSVTQTDAAGNVSVIQRQFLVDTVAPMVTITLPAANAEITDSFVISGACESGLEVSASGAGLATMVAGACVNSAYALPANLSANLGAKTFTVAQTDASANKGMVTRNVTRIAPVTTPPAIAFAQPLAGTAAQTGVTITGTCESPLTVNISGAVTANSTTTCVNGQFSAAITFSAGDGSKAISVSQTNSVNLTGTVSRTFVRDNVKPVVTIVNPVAATSVGATSIVNGLCENGIPVVIYGTGVSANVSANCVNGTYSGTVTFTPGDGQKELRAGQTDTATNFGVATVMVNADTTAPAVKIVEPATGTLSSYGLTLKGTCETGLLVTAGGAGIASPTEAVCAANAYTLNVIFSSGDGTKNVTVTQRDGAGNSGRDQRDFLKGDFVSQGTTLYAMHCAGCHGALAMSTKLNRTAAQINTARINVGSMAGNAGVAGLTAQQVDAIAAALHTATPADVANPFTCAPGSDPAVAQLKRLTHREYVNTLLDLFAGTVVLSDFQTELGTLQKEAVVDHPAVRLYDTINSTDMNLRLLTAYNDIGGKIADVIVANATKMNTAAGNTCITAATVTDACVTSVMGTLGLRAFRRPPTAAEITAYLALYRTGTTPSDSFARLIQALLTSPQFLYHLYDGGTLVAGRTDLYTFSPYETASKISYALIGSMPDAALFAAAANGSLATSAGVQTQVDRLFALPKARDAVRDFYAQWLRLDNIPVTNVTPAFADGINPTQFQAEARQEIIDFMDNAIWTQKGNFETLMTSNVIFPKGANLARAYGVSVSANPVNSADPNRKGLLTRAGMVSMSSAGTTDPIKRGVRLRFHFLCDNLGAPPANAIELAAKVDPLTSTRTQTAIKTSPQNCISCHSQINPIGFAFENYDVFGRFRLQETVTSGAQNATWAIDAKAVPNILSASEGQVDGAVQLQQAMLKYHKAPACLTKQYMQYKMGRMTASEDSCSLAPMYDALMKSGGSMQDMFKSLSQTPNFRLKKIN